MKPLSHVRLDHSRVRNVLWGAVWYLLFAVGSPPPGIAQDTSEASPEILHDSLYTGVAFDKSRLSPQVELGLRFHHQDLLGGVMLGVRDYVNLWNFGLGMDYRLGRKAVLVSTGDHFYYQFWEQRQYLYLKGQKQILPITSEKSAYGGYVALRWGMYYGHYDGTERIPPSYMIISPGAGLAVNVKNKGYVRLGYEYFPVRNSELANHKIYVGFSFNVRL